MAFIQANIFMPLCDGIDTLLNSQTDIVLKIMRNIYLAQQVTKDYDNIESRCTKQPSMLHKLSATLKMKPVADLDSIVADLRDVSGVPIFSKHVLSYIAGCGLAAEMYSDSYQVIKNLESRNELRGSLAEINQLKYCLVTLIGAYSFSADLLHKTLKSASLDAFADSINRGLAELAGPQLARTRINKIKSQISKPAIVSALEAIAGKSYASTLDELFKNKGETAVPMYA